MSLSNLVSYNLLRSLRRHSALINFCATSLAVKRAQEKRASFDIESVFEEYRRNLFQMAILAKAYNARVLFATQPFVGLKSPRTEKEEKLMEKQILSQMQAYYSKLILAARAVAVKTGTSYLNTTDVFDGIREDIFHDPAHFHIYGGNQIVAKKISEEIIKNRLLEN